MDILCDSSGKCDPTVGVMHTCVLPTLLNNFIRNTPPPVPVERQRVSNTWFLPLACRPACFQLFPLAHAHAGPQRRDQHAAWEQQLDALARGHHDVRSPGDGRRHEEAGKKHRGPWSWCITEPELITRLSPVADSPLLPLFNSVGRVDVHFQVCVLTQIQSFRARQEAECDACEQQPQSGLSLVHHAHTQPQSPMSLRLVLVQTLS